MYNDQNYNFKSSIGKNKIFEVPINTFQNQVKNFDWVENKLYKPADKVVVKSIIDMENESSNTNHANVMSKIHSFKLRIDIDINLKPKISNVSYLKDFLINSYQKNERECSEEFQSLVKFMVENIKINEIETNLLLNSLTINKNSQQYKDILKIIKKYSNSILIAINYQVIEGKELDNLKNYLISLVRKNKEESKDNQSFNREYTNDYSLLIDRVELNRSNSNEIKDHNYIISLLVNELKNLVNDYNLSNEYCIDLLMKNRNNTKDAAKNHFYNKYKSDKLGVIYVLPSGEEKKVELDLMSDSQNIYTQTFVLCPELDNPKLYYLGKEFELNFQEVVYIGGMNLNQNIRMVIKN